MANKIYTLVPGIEICPGFFSNTVDSIISENVLKRKFYVKGKNKQQNILKTLSSFLDQKLDSYVVNSSPEFFKGSYVVLLGLNQRCCFTKRNERKLVDCPKGTLIIISSSKWSLSFPRQHVITFFSADLPPLKDIYLSTKDRIKFRKVVRDKLSNIKAYPIGQQCITSLVNTGKLLGRGDYGNVYDTAFPHVNFAIKLTRLKPEAVQYPYNRFYSSWFEVLIMRDILNYNIEESICPNLPFLLDSFVCNNCKLELRTTSATHPCAILITELANGTLRDFLKGRATDEEIYSALFQVMAGLHAIQMRGQIMNFDVKADNILFYNVTPGGYWVYKILGKTFYVPNKGKMFVINDFGISRPMSPEFQYYREPDEETFRLGSRFAVVMDGKFHPLEAKREANRQGKMYSSSKIQWSNDTMSNGAQFRLYKKSQKVINSKTELTPEQITYLEYHGCVTDPLKKEFFMSPIFIPPFEFFNDTQDAIRIFIGGKRTTQRGHHTRYPTVRKKVYDKLKIYNSPEENMAGNKFSTNPSEVLAGYFIKEFFTKNHDYTKKQNQIISSFTFETLEK